MDWWACGLTFYACTVREHLFNGADKDAIFQRILGAPLDLGKLEQHSVLLQDLVEKLLVRDPSLRLGTDGETLTQSYRYPTLALLSNPALTQPTPTYATPFSTQPCPYITIPSPP